MTSVNDLRESFLSFFDRRGHTRKASAPLVPQNDPTLLFVNAGMVPFKSVFTGLEKAPAPSVVTSQKCVRAGGKHNDLDNVGFTARHHTFFEMLGNFSFGEYFKERAISLAWEYVTKELGLPKEKLLVTVYSEDDESTGLWQKISGLDSRKIIKIASSDNFWAMGSTGPCGPCSEIFYDHGEGVAGGPPGSPDEDGDRFVEIWNLVFMQYDQLDDDSRESLPCPCIDTGMGLERMAAVMQGVQNNFDIDLFRDLITAAEEVYENKAEGEAISSFRVIADHIRASAFLIADGVMPSNEGRGYVLRRIMRRAMRHGHSLGAREPKMFALAQSLASAMGHAFPELNRAGQAIASVIEQEETRFQDALGRGLVLLENELSNLNNSKLLPGDIAFKLYDTYGFPIDMTEDLLRDRGMEVDIAGFEKAMDSQRESSRKSWNETEQNKGDKVWFKVKELRGSTEFVGYENLDSQSELVAIIKNGESLQKLVKGHDAVLCFRNTPFYAESGGQAGDHGVIQFTSHAKFVVKDVLKKANDLHAHIGKLIDGNIQLGDFATLAVNGDRRTRIKANHSATHLMHAALRNILGTHVVQKGSLVEEDRLRFDFSHSASVTPTELEAIEDQVNAVIRQNVATRTSLSSPEEAVAAGALALFGDKYDDEVRVLSMGVALDDPNNPYSVELCGGTHVERTGDIGLFTITSESGVATGIRRIEAVTGESALIHLRSQARIATDLASQLKIPLKNVSSRVTSLVKDKRLLEKELADTKKKLNALPAENTQESKPESINGFKLVAKILDGVGGKALRELIDEEKAILKSGVVALVSRVDGKVALSIGVTKDLTDKISAVDLVRAASAVVGGKGGGGRPDMAQAGGSEVDKVPDSIDTIRKLLSQIGD